MNVVLKEKYDGIKTKITEKDTEIEIGKNKVKLQQAYIEQLEEDKKKRKSDTQTLIDAARTVIIQLTSEVNQHKANVSVLSASITDSDTQVAKDKKLKILKDKLVDKVKAINKEIEFYKTHDQCPTCNQGIDQEFKDHAVHDHEEKRKELDTACADLVKQINDVEYRLEEIQKVKDQIADINETIIDLNGKIIAEQNYILKLEKDLIDDNNDTTNIDEEKNKLKELAREVIALSSLKSTLIEEKHYLDVAGILLKDTGIKTKVIRQYLPVINKLVNKFLQAMDFFVSFELDESFNETIKSRHRDEFSYASFSEGEKAKIDLALLFAWRSIARMKNSANTNLLMLDEVFDGSLDINGTDYVMTILNTIGEENNIFVISHKDALFDKFRSVIKFEKHQSFSRIAK